MIKRLLDADADVHAVDKCGDRPEHFAKFADKVSQHWGKRKEDKYSNVYTYMQELVSHGYDVAMDEEGDLYWPAKLSLS